MLKIIRKNLIPKKKIRIIPQSGDASLGKIITNTRAGRTILKTFIVGGTTIATHAVFDSSEVVDPVLTMGALYLSSGLYNGRTDYNFKNFIRAIGSAVVLPILANDLGLYVLPESSKGDWANIMNDSRLYLAGIGAVLPYVPKIIRAVGLAKEKISKLVNRLKS